MDASSTEQLNLHWEVLPKPTKKALDFLSTQEWLEKSNWYLAGGTALALQTGHRTSVDLDFFTTQGSFELVEVTDHFKDNKNWIIDREKVGTIFAKLYDAKTSFIAYPFFVPKQEYLRYGTVSILRPLDIAVMKIVAISQRGKKRDFIDLYWCAHNLESLENLIKRLREQYPSVAHDFHHIIKSLAYFDDAEVDPPLVLHSEIEWKKVKTFFVEEIKHLAFKFV
ncbi:MAG: nucleotidyl transferase AbiEii/AbiGii toxin family protein [Candidatus Paceibacterota bacterium]|jgi:hypothetical protein